MMKSLVHMMKWKKKEDYFFDEEETNDWWDDMDEEDFFDETEDADDEDEPVEMPFTLEEILLNLNFLENLSLWKDIEFGWF